MLLGTLMLGLGWACILGAALADRYSPGSDGLAAILLLGLAAVMFGLFVWRQARQQVTDS